MKDPGRSRHWNHQTHPGASTRASYVMIFVFALLNVACEASPYPWLATYSCAEHQIGVIGPNDTDTDTDTDDTDGRADRRGVLLRVPRAAVRGPLPRRDLDP